MAVFEMNGNGGGGSTLDLLSPIGTLGQSYSTTPSGTVDVTVTQKPKIIIVTLWTISSGSGYVGFTGIIDVEKNLAKKAGRGSADYTLEDWATSSWQTYITAIEDNYVRYNKAAIAAAHRVYIECY